MVAKSKTTKSDPKKEKAEEMDGGAAKKKTTTKAAPKKTTKASGSKTSKPKTKKAATPKSKKRSFKMIDPNTMETVGRYTGDPRQAASKASTKKISKLKKSKGKVPSSFNVYLRESTRGGSRKTYGYQSTPVRLPEPQTFEVEDKNKPGEMKTYVREFRNKIKRIDVPENLVTKKPEKKGSKKAKKPAGEKKAKKGSGSKKAKPAASKTTKTSKTTKSKKSKTSKK